MTAAILSAPPSAFCAPCSNSRPCRRLAASDDATACLGSGIVRSIAVTFPIDDNGRYAGVAVGLDGAAVVRPPNNPFIADWVARQRRINGPSTMIAKHNAARGMLTQLRAGRMLCMLMDQKLREGIAVPFFGHDAMTTPAPAALALKTGARVVLAANRRLPGPRFHVTVYEPPAITPSGDEAQDTKALTAAFTLGIEEIVRADPGQWLWIHNRWPTKRDAELMRGKV